MYSVSLFSHQTKDTLNTIIISALLRVGFPEKHRANTQTSTVPEVPGDMLFARPRVGNQ